MTNDADIQQQILQRTLQEVAQEQLQDDVSNPCVICLEPITEPAVAEACNHANFDFLCLVSWLEQRRNCPLCKSDVSSVKYDLENRDGPKIYQLPAIPAASANATSTTHISHPRSRHRITRRPRSPRNPPPQAPDDPIRRRQHVYRNRLYSLRVGSNRLSQYREFNPEMFNRDEELVSRARKWIRRELRVFEFLNPDTQSDSQVARPGQGRLQSRRGNNAAFLLEYIIAILRTVDIKGSAGQAEELLRDFLGRDNASLFLHELQAWLRSPYTSLEDWDRNVQYENPATQGGRSDSAASDRTSTPVYRGGGRAPRGRVAKHRYSRGQHYQEGARDSLARRIQYARDRYLPD
ncbi:RING finger domain protein [Aspergillus lucknowensis]|uniref:RING-type E3 ubiquitin transferase n=1 Tax=Aspergillus lucknowensis TaxID=176173 RepID=A0ABR4LMU7_9EURO